MKIRNLIDHQFNTASILEDTRDIFDWLRQEKYLVIKDESSQTTGIITIKDLLNHPDSRNVIDCLIDKPRVNPEQTIFEVFKIMKESGNEYLPVYSENDFIGVVTLMKLAGRLIEIVSETKQYCQQGIVEIRSSLTNIQGLTSLIDNSNTAEETQEIVQLANNCCNNAMEVMEALLNVDNDESNDGNHPLHFPK